MRSVLIFLFSLAFALRIKFERPRPKSDRPMDERRATRKSRVSSGEQSKSEIFHLFSRPRAVGSFGRSRAERDRSAKFQLYLTFTICSFLRVIAVRASGVIAIPIMRLHVCPRRGRFCASLQRSLLYYTLNLLGFRNSSLHFHLPTLSFFSFYSALSSGGRRRRRSSPGKMGCSGMEKPHSSATLEVHLRRSAETARSRHSHPHVLHSLRARAPKKLLRNVSHVCDVRRESTYRNSVNEIIAFAMNI